MATTRRINEPLALTPLAGLGAVILTGILWGTIGVVTGQLKAAFPGVDGGPSTLSSLLLVVIRLGITAPAAAITARILLGRGAFRLPRRLLGLGLGLVQAFFQYAYVEAVTNAGVGIATAIELCLAPVLVATLSVLFLRERPDRLIVGAILFAAVGTVVLATSGAATAKAETFQVGILWSLACMVGYASYIVLARRLAAGIHPLELVTLASAGGFAVLTLWSTIVGVKTPDLTGKDLLVPGLQFAYLALIATCLAYALFVSGVRATSATTGSLGALAMPPTATVLAALLLNQVPTIEVVAGQALLMAAMTVTILRTAQRTNA